MPRLIFSPRAIGGLKRCRAFLAEKNPDAAHRASQVINRQLRLLTANPAIGRPSPQEIGWRELIIPFGDSGYIALYRHIAANDTVQILAFRHQREDAY
jgi:plasmid stabilization system protein ParE